MRSEGIRGSYVAATDGIPLPPTVPQSTPTVGLVTCARCDLRTRPGAFHICLEPVPDDPAPAPKPKPQVDKKPPPDDRTRRHEKRAVLPKAPQCKCGKRIARGSQQCRDCFRDSHPKPDCGTIEGYRWHRRQARINPGPHNPWPLPKADVCGCRAAQAEHSRQRRESLS